MSKSFACICIQKSTHVQRDALMFVCYFRVRVCGVHQNCDRSSQTAFLQHCKCERGRLDLGEEVAKKAEDTYGRGRGPEFARWRAGRQTGRQAGRHFASWCLSCVISCVCSNDFQLERLVWQQCVEYFICFCNDRAWIWLLVCNPSSLVSSQCGVGAGRVPGFLQQCVFTRLVSSTRQWKTAYAFACQRRGSRSGFLTV